MLTLSCITNAYAQKPIRFPEGFRWCAATAAHQIEGGNTQSDWWDWEHAGKHIKNGDTSLQACDHWNRLEEDTQLLKDLGVTEYRFSVEWAKIEPADGQWNSDAIQHYRKEVELLLKAGIRPMVTLQHFTFPRWLSSKGGWEWTETPARFERFTRLVYQQIAPEAKEWVTINEPFVDVLGGYYSGQFPPGEKRAMQEIVPVIRGMLRAHALAYHALHDEASKQGSTLRVGMAHHLRTFDAAHPWNVLHLLAAHWFDEAWNWALPNALQTGELKIHIPFTIDVEESIAELAHTQDFFGLNYYTGDLISFSVFKGITIGHRAKALKSDLGWDIYPKGLARLLSNIHSLYPDLSVFITENGIADASDEKRPKYLTDHLKVVAQAISKGVQVEGYCIWSWLDNFEWDEGYSARFGLYEVDYATERRIPRKSAELFREIATKNQLPIKPY